MITQRQIARRCGIDVSSVNKILRRKKGSVFKRRTVERVLKVAQALGYDFGRVKHTHRRQHPRTETNLRVELSIYLEDGKLFDRGSATVREISLSGACLSGIELPRRSLPITAHTLGLRALDGPLGNLELLGRPIRLNQRGSELSLAVEFDRNEEDKARQFLAKSR